jgi:hypothetical protein
MGDDAGQIAAGVAFGVLIPAALLALSFYLVIKHLTLVVRWGDGPAPARFCCSVVLAVAVATGVAVSSGLGNNGQWNGQPEAGCRRGVLSPLPYSPPRCLQLPLQRSAFYVPAREAQRYRGEQRQRKLERQGSLTNSQAGSAAAGESDAGGLARASSGAASVASNGSGSQLGATLLRQAQPGSARAGGQAGSPGSGFQQPEQQQQQQDTGAGKLWSKRMKRWFVQFFLRPAFG